MWIWCLALIVAWAVPVHGVPILGVTVTDRAVIVHRQAGERQRRHIDIPDRTTAARIELYLNDWFLKNVPECQVRVKVLRMSPLLITLGTWNHGEAIDPNWWEQTP